MRIQLGTPIVARVGKAQVVLLDISAHGARIQHTFPLTRGNEISLNFQYDDISVEMPCGVIRCKFEKHGERASYYSGLRFIDRQDGSLSRLRDIIAKAVSEDFEARRKHMASSKR
jgi:hypothetical protein